MRARQLKRVSDAEQVQFLADTPANAPDFLDGLAHQQRLGPLRVSGRQRQHALKLWPLFGGPLG